jgi:ketosteroid isomerase-like protein
MNRAFIVLILSLCVRPAFSQPSGLQSELDAMVAAERAFSKLSVEKGFKESFLTYIADDGIMFRPTPVKGKEMLAARPDPPIELVWWPSHADIARSGDLGWTTGPWERRAKGSDQVLTGHFLTVWKKQSDGQWRWVADTGIEHGKPDGPPGSPAPVAAEKVQAKVSKVDLEAATKDLLAADRALGEATPKGLAAAYLARLTDDARLLRNGSFPLIGKAAIRPALEKPAAVLSSVPGGGGVSAAGDLGYTYGTAEWKGQAAAQVGYLRIWERHDGAWKLRVDWVDDPPPAPAKP